MKASGETSAAAPPEAVVGPLTVVNPEPRVRDGAQLRDRFKEVRVEHLGSIAPIEAFDVRVLVRLAGLDVVRRDAVLGTPVDERLRGEFGAVVPSEKRS